MLDIENAIDHVKLYLSYKQLQDTAKTSETANNNECIKGIFIDDSLAPLTQTYIDTLYKYGAQIYPIDFSLGKSIT